jgi:hypothetical protein
MGKNRGNYVKRGAVDFSGKITYNTLELLWTSIGRYENGYEKATTAI